MAESKHTAGPWTAKPSKYNEGEFIVQAGMPSNRVLARFGSDDELLDETDVANARLIAAAPDLLIAVQRCLNFIEGTEAEFGEEFECGNMARAAIAKAEGQ